MYDLDTIHRMNQEATKVPRHGKVTEPMHSWELELLGMTNDSHTGEPRNIGKHEEYPYR